MNRNDLFRAVGETDEDLLLESEHPRQHKKPAFIALLAAALAVVLLVLPHGNGGLEGPDDSLPTENIAGLAFNGAFYEATDLPEVLERFGLPPKITADLAGRHLAYLESDGGCGYRETGKETGCELLEYAPFPCRAVMVLRDGERYQAVLFCSVIREDTNDNMELCELFRCFYEIEDAGDLASVTPVDWQRRAPTGPSVKDPAALREFYRIAGEMPSFGNDDFQRLQFGDIPEEEQPAAHTAFADDLQILRVETVDGLCFYLSVYPEFRWAESGGALSYYRLDDAALGWLREYIL